MKLHEYQAKDLLRNYVTNVSTGKVAFSAEEAEKAFRELKSTRAVLKAQILAGGRGRAGGIKKVNTPEEARTSAEKLLGSRLVTAQTTPEGEKVQAVLVQEVLDIKKELYVSLLLDRRRATLILMGCSEGGVEIEDVARRSPEKIFRESFDILFGLHPFQARRMASALGLSGQLTGEAASLFKNLSRAFIEKDLSLLEINPLAVCSDGSLSIIDAKADLDDNAGFRHPELFKDKPSGEESLEARASAYGLSYVGLEGDIGCLVNGAGLAMATMDIIRHYGGRPANFLDIGGDAAAEKVTQAFRILFEDARLKAILVNIFGGIVKCDMIAESIISALKDVKPGVPLVVRLEGTNAHIARKMLAESGLEMLFTESMEEAAKRVLEATERNTS
ncbi:MAG: ADP-forming succinate--CoA ligase subunit beta [Candidatus Brocadiales bacterium]|nr:ADP-forming succinate--CoA ligase subunit beta [Candidatus Bathyanammoxibius amoris]